MVADPHLEFRRRSTKGQNNSSMWYNWDGGLNAMVVLLMTKDIAY